MGGKFTNMDMVHIDHALFDEITGCNVKWTPEERIMACTYYQATGSSEQAAKHCASAGSPIPPATIRDWKTRSAWWKPVTHEVRKAKQEQLDAKLTEIIMSGTNQLIDRIEHGNVRINPKTGDQERIPLNSTELARDAVGIPYDKRALLRGDPTSRVEKVDPKQMLEELATQFVKIVKMNEPKVIDGEVIDESD